MSKNVIVGILLEVVRLPSVPVLVGDGLPCRHPEELSLLCLVSAWGPEVFVSHPWDKELIIILVIWLSFDYSSNQKQLTTNCWWHETQPTHTMVNIMKLKFCPRQGLVNWCLGLAIWASEFVIFYKQSAVSSLTDIETSSLVVSAQTIIFYQLSLECYIAARGYQTIR